MRVEFKIVAHIVSRDAKQGATARLVLEDPDGFHRAVLAVGEPRIDEWAAVESAVRTFEAQVRP